MSKKATDFQRKVMSLGYRGKEIFKPLNTGWIDDRAETENVKSIGIFRCVK